MRYSLGYLVWSTMRCVFAGIAVVVLGACKDLTQELPDGMLDPAVVRTPEGAVSLYKGAKVEFLEALTAYVSQTAIFTDESVAPEFRSPANYAGRIPESIDARNPKSGELSPYRQLHGARNQLDQATKLLTVFAAETPEYYRGELYALHGFVLTYFAELFCSGIPLTKVAFDGDFILAPGIRRDSLLQIALASFDSSIAHNGDDPMIVQLAHVGAARAWLQRDEIAQAAVHARQVDPAFSYALPLFQGTRIGGTQSFSFRLSDREGLNGLPYRSSGDPRIVVTRERIGTGNDTTWFVTKYTGTSAKIPVAMGLEALLIVAEEALVDGDTSWLAQINALRTNGGLTVSSAGDTSWHAGIGAVAGLRPLTDPADDSLPPGATALDVRLDLLFRERAYWLYITGHRQGDLRRLVRHYNRDAEQTYPSGSYGRNGAQFGARYGTEVVVPTSDRERDLNPLYQGCFDMEA